MNAGLKYSTPDDEPMIEMNMTPLIDVMLVLIIMLIITIPIQNHAVNLNMPTGAPPPPATPPVVVSLDINADGTVLWDKAVVPDRLQLEAKMKATAAQANPPEIHLRPDKSVSYKSVAAVMAAAQRTGVTKIGLVGSEQFDR
ncbi:MAG: biopolymer transporter ExbD [Pseudomonadota bacterium]